MFGIQIGRMGAFGRKSAYSPSKLFASGEQGIWLDPSDFSTMFQDSAGTTPVTADGQPVGKILDKSGRGNHASQATANSRPLYKTDGTYHWLQFDGVDDSLSTAAINFNGTDKLSIFFGASTSSSANQGIISIGTSGAGSLNAIYATDTPPGIRGALTGDSSFSQIVVAGNAAGTKQTVSQLYDLSGATVTDDIKIRKNGSLPTQTVAAPGPAGGGTMQNTSIILGNFVGLMLAGNIYSMIVRGALSTADEIAATETWVNGKTGAF